MQIANWLNYAGNLEGLQISLVNIAKNFKGLQLGAINYAHNIDRGLQIGLLNIIAHDGWLPALVMVNGRF